MMRQVITPKLAQRAIVVMIILQMTYQVILLSKGTDYVVSQLTIDDTYYYLQTAWNMKNLGFVTFDGIHKTNGVQFLWFWILFLFSHLVHTKIAFLYLALMIAILMNAASYLPIISIGRQLNSGVLMIILGLLWFNVNIMGGRTYLSGMENSLHALIVWLLLASSMSLFSTQHEREFNARYILFTILLVLNVWARVDAVILSACFFVVILWLKRSQLKMRTLLTSLVIALLGSVVLFAGFYFMGGSFLPVSGMIKSQNYSFNLDLLAILFSRSFELLTPVRYFVWHASDKQYQGIAGPLILGAITFVGVSSALLRQKHLPSVRITWTIMAISSLVSLLFLSGLGTFAEYGVWYQSVYFVFSAFSLALLMDILLKSIFLTKAHLKLIRVVVTLLMVLCVIVYAIFLGRFSYHTVRSNNYQADLHYIRYEFAKWIDENYPSGITLASYSAGQIGFFSNRPTINLDGLVNSPEYYRNVIIGKTKITEYLQQNHVDYVIDYCCIPDEVVQLSREIATPFTPPMRVLQYYYSSW
ncbi:MAG: hypothetical protein QXS54_11195 [Candidatus Methanomethylicaceae archaeon]